jgi:hypothetical protein
VKIGKINNKSKGAISKGLMRNPTLRKIGFSLPVRGGEAPPNRKRKTNFT